MPFQNHIQIGVGELPDTCVYGILWVAFWGRHRSPTSSSYTLYFHLAIHLHLFNFPLE